MKRQILINISEFLIAKLSSCAGCGKKGSKEVGEYYVVRVVRVCDTFMYKSQRWEIHFFNGVAFDKMSAPVVFDFGCVSYLAPLKISGNWLYLT